MRIRALGCAAAAAVATALALPGAAQAGWSAPGDLPVTNATQVEATMSPQGTATVGATQSAGPTDVYSRGPKAGAAYKLVRSLGPCADVSDCPFALDAGAERGFNLAYEGKTAGDVGVSSMLTAYMRSAGGSLSEDVLAGPMSGTTGWEARIASNGTERAVAVWRNGPSLEAATKSASSDRFGATANLSEANATQPSVSMGSRGTAAIATRFGPENLRLFRRPAGHPWESAIVPAADPERVASVVNPDGRIWAFFNAEDQLWFRIWRSEDTQPANAETLCFGGPATRDPDVEVGPDGKPRLAFSDPNGDLRVTSIAGTCRDPYVIDARNVLDYSFDVRGGRAVLAWVDELASSTPETPRYALRAKAGRVDRLSKAKTVRVGGNPDQVSAAVDAKGNAVVAYRRTTDSRELGAEVLSFRAKRGR